LRRIATEEGFNIPEVARATARILPELVSREPGEAAVFGVDRPRSDNEAPPPWLHRLSDIGAGRIADMDSAGIAMQLLLLSHRACRCSKLARRASSHSFKRQARRRDSQSIHDRFTQVLRPFPARPCFRNAGTGTGCEQAPD
jgi:hypothetical protein